jgi:HPt (histidine-containing phosphotransfer) domain-containing protein
LAILFTKLAKKEKKDKGYLLYGIDGSSRKEYIFNNSYRTFSRKGLWRIEMTNVISGANGAIYINVDEALKRVMNNKKLFAKLLTKFKTENANLLDDTIKFVRANDYEKAKISIHTLKGIAANLSLTEFYKQIVEFETQIKGGATKSDTQDSLKECLDETLILADGVIAQYGE